MTTTFKRVAAVDKCFAILALFAQSKEPLGISAVARQLGFNKSTVYNTIYTLTDLGVLENGTNGQFRLGTRLYMLGNTAGKRSELIQTVHPYLEAITRATNLSAFLGIRSGNRAIIIDKVDSGYDIKITSDVGMQIPILAGAGGKALLSQLSNEEIDTILSENRFNKFTPNTIVDRDLFKQEVLKTQKEGIAFDREEYIEGIRALSVPLKTYRKDAQAAIWAVGLKRQVSEALLPEQTALLKETADQVNRRFYMTSGTV